MTTAASSTGTTILTALRQLAAKIEPTRAEQKAQADYRRMTTVQQVRHLDQMRTKCRKQGEGIVQYVKLIGSLTANRPNDARERTRHGRPTQRAGTGNRKKPPPDRGVVPATPDEGHKSSPILRVLTQMANRHEAQRKAKEKAKKNRPWRNVPLYYAKQKERLQHRPAKAATTT